MAQNDESSDDSQGDTKERFENLCRDLNMDEETSTKSWSSYEKINTNYTLEGDALHWLACALYVECRNSVHPTVDQQGTVEGNCVSLTRLLRASKLSLIQFFQKMKKWADMAHLSQDFRKKIELLERNFNVSNVIFKKFEPIFVDIFKKTKEDTPKGVRGRKQRKQPCTASEVFNFCWTLYVRVKGNFPAISDDLVNSYHLLLSCLDLFFANALYTKHRKDLLNSQFQELPSNFNEKDYKPPESVPCIVERLCNKHQGIVIEAKGIKEHYWKPFLKKLFETRVLKGKEEDLTGILDQGNFEYNCKSVGKEYEEYVLSHGDFDERIFLGVDAHLEIGTPAKTPALNQGSTGDEKEGTRVGLRRNLQENFSKAPKSLAPLTPLTGRRYLKEKDPRITPVSTATQSVSRLQAMLAGLKPHPSEKLQVIFKECSKNPQEAIETRVQELGDLFLTEYCQPSPERPDSPPSTKEFANNRLKLAVVLYFKVLENITLTEKNRLKGNLNLITLLEQDALHRSLLACCLEIVIFSYNSQRTFPWIIEVFKLSPYHFYKVIEVLIKAEEGLSRDVVKHLNHIEEQILECMAWQHDSPLWDAISCCENIPSCEEVTIPHVDSHAGNPLLHSPIIHPRVQRLSGEATTTGRRVLSPTSPVMSSLQDRFGSPVTTNARRNLLSQFGGQSNAASEVQRISFPNHTPIAPALPLATNTTALNNNAIQQVAPQLVSAAPRSTTVTSTHFVTNGTVNYTTSPGGIMAVVTVPRSMIQTASPQNVPSSPVRTITSPIRTTMTSPVSAAATNHTNQPMKSPTKPKRTGSLALFFRKLYHLASVRLRDLCAKLDISEELRGKIWTCFEHVVVTAVELMKDRHLDQMLMCAIYVMAKVTSTDITFQNIMKCYRTQPQAASHVYRSVLIRYRKKLDSSGNADNKGIKNESGSTTVSPGQSQPSSPSTDGIGSNRTSPQLMRCTSVVPATPPPVPSTTSAINLQQAIAAETMEGERGDLIEFYNKVFIKKVKQFALKFSSNEKSLESPALSPLPAVRNNPHSPRRQVSTKHPVYISPHKNGAQMTPNTRMLYCFNQSPSKKLRDINEVIKTGGGELKRALLQDDTGASPAKRPAAGDLLMRRLRDMQAERTGPLPNNNNNNNNNNSTR